MRTQYKAKAFETGQKDNIVRDGVLTTKQAYDMFLRAGLTTKEWLEKTYKSKKQPTTEEMKDIEQAVRKYEDKLDIQDTINEVNKSIEYANIKKEELLKQQELLKNKLAEEKTKQDNIDNKAQ